MAEEFATKSHGDVIEFYYNWKFHEPDYSRWQLMKRQIDIALVSYTRFFQSLKPVGDFRSLPSAHSPILLYCT